MLKTCAQHLCDRLSLDVRRVEAVLSLLDEGCTVPFLARYRKEQTGSLDEEKLREIVAARAQWEALEARRKTVLDSLAEQGISSRELLEQVRSADSLTLLEDLYLPYRPKRQTRGQKAIELGLDPLARLILQQPQSPLPEQAAKKHLGAEVSSVEEALAGARDVVAERAAEEPSVRREVREKAQRFSRLEVRKKRGAEDPKEVYRSYYEFATPVNRLAPHQVLALDRGEKEKVLSVGLELDERDYRTPLQRTFRPREHSPWGAQLQSALDEGAKRLLLPALERELRKALTEKAQEHAIEVFARNLKGLLMTPPLADRVVLAIDPAFRSGCKLAVVDPTGKLLDTAVVTPHPPQNRGDGAREVLDRLVERHRVTLVAIGNGTASRETEKLAAELTGRHSDLAYLLVSEAGASVYSASPLARAEFPDLDVTLRGAVSIGRRVQDPLAELIKIDPKAIGVGLYQHDLNEKRLDQALAAVVESVVHQVGVELNTASAPLLAHLGGIGPKLAREMVAHRDRHGPYPTRAALKKVKGLGPKAFEQSAGFLRIRDGDDPLDATAIHPESYPVARRLLKLTGGDLSRLDDPALLAQVDCPEPTLRDIVAQLKKPSRDPRLELPKPLLRRDVLSLTDLYPGLVLHGTVRNVVDFGAFIDIGVKQDGLLHRSQLKGQRLAVGQVLEVEVLEVDEQRGRISLATA